jgi:peptidoglycan/xylan/chitin deacetylase (PgdA/CDA1 family)
MWQDRTVRPRVPTVLSASLLITSSLAASALAEPGASPEERAAPAAVGQVTVVVDQPLISPNEDGRVDRATITAGVDLPTSVRIEVIDGAGAVRRSWTMPASSEAPATVSWDGRDAAGALVEGASIVRAADTAPAGLGSEASTAVAVDVHPPSFRWRGMTGSGRFRFAAQDDAGPMRVAVEVADGAGTVATIERDVGAGRTTLRWSRRRLYPGTYAATLRITDAVGNTRTAGPYPWREERPMHARVWRRVENAGPRVALTIDDCHEEGAWSSMLQTLQERGAGATFFCPGQMIAAHPELVRRTIREGHEIGSHGWDHALLTGHSEGAVASRLERDADTLWRVAKHTTAPYFRPPYGAYDPEVVAAAGQTSHPGVILWDVDTGDWASPGVGTIIGRAVDQARAGSIILLHTKPQSAAALPAIISGLRERGLEPVGLPELFAA